MKLIRDFTSHDVAHNFSLKLRGKGIPTHVAMFRGNNTHRYGGGPKTWAVWVLVDTQLDDAIRLIKGSRHEVRNPLNEEEIVAIEMELLRKGKNEILRNLSVLLIALVGLVAFVISIWLDKHA
ncbi:MAG: hypothetical protein ACI9OH_000904 [Oleispira sp.]|jgi:hypothetical protein